jgi:hypothetical protein
MMTNKLSRKVIWLKSWQIDTPRLYAMDTLPIWEMSPTIPKQAGGPLQYFAFETRAPYTVALS